MSSVHSPSISKPLVAMSSPKGINATLYKDKHGNLHLCTTDFADMKQWNLYLDKPKVFNHVQCLFDEDDDDLDERVHIYDHEEECLVALLYPLSKQFRNKFKFKNVGTALYYRPNSCKFCGFHHDISDDECDDAVQEKKKNRSASSKKKKITAKKQKTRR